MLDFLQGFDADRLLIELNEDYVTHHALQKAVEIAMLGLVDECNNICRVLADHGQFASDKASLAFQCIWTYSDVQPPNIVDDNDGAVWIPSKSGIRRNELESRKRLSHLPKWLDWDSIDTTSLEKMRDVVGASRKHEFAGSSTGYLAMRVSNEYAAIIYMASDLDRLDLIADLLPLMVRRIHANQQAHVLSLIPCLWKDYFLDGWLRRQLSLTEEAVREYSHFVLNTITQRFEHGPCRPEEVFAGFTVSQLLEVIDENTVSTPSYRHIDEQPDDGDSNRRSHSIMHPGATSEQISEAETRMGHKLPEDFADFFKLSNGCEQVRVSKYHCLLRLPSLDQIFFEDDGDDYMHLYTLETVPKLPRHLDPEWPGIEGGGIAMYENDGQGTQYVWILGAEGIKRSKEKLQVVYDNASTKDKAIIDRHIRYWYGDRETYDAMQDHCYLEVHWGAGTEAVYPTFKSYLAMVACRSRHVVERSPLKVEYDT